MTKEEYLIARGWKRSGGDKMTRWRDPIGNADGYAIGLTTFSTDSAEKRQLDRDAAVRDFVDKHRPPEIVYTTRLLDCGFTAEANAARRNGVRVKVMSEADTHGHGQAWLCRHVHDGSVAFYDPRELIPSPYAST